MRPIALGGLLAVTAVAAQGQTCLGLPSFGRAPMHVSVGLTTGDDVTTVGGGLSWGTPAGLFGGVNLGLVDIDNVDESAFVIGGGIGYQMSAASTRRTDNVRELQFCPVATLQYQMGPEFEFFDETIDLSALSLSGGVALGVPVEASATFQLIPTGTIALAYTKVTADLGTFGSGSDTETYGVITLGVGFLMNGTVSIKPYVDIPVGLEGADARLGILVAFGIGRR